jgi:F0F1-type ATP synthase assembly protein I
MAADEPKGPNVPIGFMVAGSEMASFTILGLLIDYAAGTMPWFTIVLTLLGLVAAFFQLKRMAKTLAAKKPPPPSAGGPTGSGT